MHIMNKIKSKNLKGEIWKELTMYGIHYEGYEVSNKGRIRSVDRQVSGRWGNVTFFGKVMKMQYNISGYPVIGIQYKRRIKTLIVSRLVANAFIREIKKGEVVHHIKGIKNNCVENLKVMTTRENCSIERVQKSTLPVGVCLLKGKDIFIAQIYNSFDKTHNTLGCYKDPIKASGAYDVALSAIKSNPKITRLEIISLVSDYRKSIGLKIMKPRKLK